MRNMPPPKESFQLPSSFSVLVRDYKSERVSTAHLLDLDILCEAPNRKAALNKLRVAVKGQMEFGIEKNWTDELIHPAPAKYWDQLDKATYLGPLPPLEINARQFKLHPMIYDARNAA